MAAAALHGLEGGRRLASGAVGPRREDPDIWGYRPAHGRRAAAPALEVLADAAPVLRRAYVRRAEPAPDAGMGLKGQPRRRRLRLVVWSASGER